jgi:hypothetical protein
MAQKVELGRLLATPDALSALAESGQSPAEFLQRHAAQDWGELCEEDRRLNDLALVQGDRLLSSYRTKKNIVIWVLTESDRSATTILTRISHRGACAMAPELA